MKHSEFHRTHRIAWLRAAVLGANDGIVSTASLIIGIASSQATQSVIIMAGIAGLVSGAMSMAAGEYVSVSSQSDTENADIAKEQKELATDQENELKELTGIYVQRGLSADLAHQVAVQLTAHDALGAHARDELGITEIATAKPTQAALASATTFAIGAALPLLVAIFSPHQHTVISVAITSLAFLVTLGSFAAHAGGASKWIGAARVTFWGVVAMLATASVGYLFGVSTA